VMHRSRMALQCFRMLALMGLCLPVFPFSIVSRATLSGRVEAKA
jgi:hypothetical protein